MISIRSIHVYKRDVLIHRNQAYLKRLYNKGKINLSGKYFIKICRGFCQVWNDLWVLHETGTRFENEIDNVKLKLII